jgi:hypothetical protein
VTPPVGGPPMSVPLGFGQLSSAGLVFNSSRSLCFYFCVLLEYSKASMDCCPSVKAFNDSRRGLRAVLSTILLPSDLRRHRVTWSMPNPPSINTRQQPLVRCNPTPVQSMDGIEHTRMAILLCTNLPCVQPQYRRSTAPRAGNVFCGAHSQVNPSSTSPTMHLSVSERPG